MKAIATGAMIILVISVAAVAVIGGSFDFSASNTFQSPNDTVRLD